MIWLGLLLGILGYCVYTTLRCFFRVNQGSVAVLLSFGAAQKEAGTNRLVTYCPGLHFKWPWQTAVAVPVMEQSLELSGQEGGQTAMAADGTVLRLDSILRYIPSEPELEQYLFGMKAPREHITLLFTCLLRNEIADFGQKDERKNGPPQGDYRSGGSYAQIRRQRHALNQRIEAFCQSAIARRYGVRFSAVDLTDILPPDELADALNAVMQAESEADTGYSLAEAECQQKLIAAHKGVAIGKEKAAAAEQEIEVLGAYLAELERSGTLTDYVARRKTEVSTQSRTLFLRS